MAVTDDYVAKARVNHPLVISLPVNQTTGFLWEIDFCDPALTCRELPYRRHRGGLGAGGKQQFEVITQKTGEFAIRFRLRRSWEAKVREVRTYRIVATQEG